MKAENKSYACTFACYSNLSSKQWISVYTADWQKSVLYCFFLAIAKMLFRLITMRIYFGEYCDAKAWNQNGLKKSMNQICITMNSVVFCFYLVLFLLVNKKWLQTFYSNSTMNYIQYILLICFSFLKKFLANAIPLIVCLINLEFTYYF